MHTAIYNAVEFLALKPGAVTPELNAGEQIFQGTLKQCARQMVGLNLRYADSIVYPDTPSCTPRQMRLWMLSKGITGAQIDALIAALPDAGTRSAAAIEFEYATEFRRDNPLIATLGTALGMDSNALDMAFDDAALL